jgi:hypothetical protein
MAEIIRSLDLQLAFLKDSLSYPIPQAIAAVFVACLFAGSISLYATLVCVACSQLEKLTATLLDIRQLHVMSVQNNGTETGQQEGQGQGHTSEDMFLHVQKQLNACIRHHQEIQRCGYCHHSNRHLLQRDTT